MHWILPVLAGIDSDVSVQAADDGRNQGRFKHSWSAFQKAPSVTVTRGWGKSWLAG